MKRVSRIILVALIVLLFATGAIEPAVMTVAIDGYASHEAVCETDTECSQLLDGCLTAACGGPESSLAVTQ